MNFLVNVWHWLTASEQWTGHDGVPHLLANHLRVALSSLFVAIIPPSPPAMTLVG